jgi:hypothetical protein
MKDREHLDFSLEKLEDCSARLEASRAERTIIMGLNELLLIIPI